MDETRGSSALPRPIDEAEALERVGGARSLLVELAGMCLADTPNALSSIRGALAGGDARSLQRAAHKLKGSLLVLAADDASEAASRLEALGASGSLGNAAAALATLEHEIDRLRPVLRELAESEVEPEE